MEMNMSTSKSNELIMPRRRGSILHYISSPTQNQKRSSARASGMERPSVVIGHSDCRASGSRH